MFLELELLIASFILFLMLFCAFEAFDRLSGGQIMKLENTEPELAEKLSEWMDRSDSIRGVFKLMLFILSSLMGMLSYSVLLEKFGNDLQTWRVLIIIAAIICSWYLGEIISRLVPLRHIHSADNPPVRLPACKHDSASIHAFGETPQEKRRRLAR